MNTFDDLSKPILDKYLENLIDRAVGKALSRHLSTNDKDDDVEELLTAKESADFIGDALQTFYGRTSRGEINTYGSGKRIFCKKSELISWKEKQRTKSKEALKEEVRTRARNKKRAK